MQLSHPQDLLSMLRRSVVNSKLAAAVSIFTAVFAFCAILVLLLVLVFVFVLCLVIFLLCFFLWFLKVSVVRLHTNTPRAHMSILSMILSQCLSCARHRETGCETQAEAVHSNKQEWSQSETLGRTQYNLVEVLLEIRHLYAVGSADVISAKAVKAMTQHSHFTQEAIPAHQCSLSHR